jgi:hypothetical protein
LNSDWESTDEKKIKIPKSDNEESYKKKIIKEENEENSKIEFTFN